MTQMNAAAALNSPQCFSQNSSTGSELASPEGNESGGSVESIRDRSHLFLDPSSSRGAQPSLLNFLKPRTNFGQNLFAEPTATTTATVAAPAVTAPTATTTAASIQQRNGITDSMLSPMLQKDFLQVVNAMMSPATRRPNNFALPLAHSAFNNLQKANPSLSIIDQTPTPTKILYPKAVTQEEKEFAEGFTKVLEKIQAQNQFTATSLNSPSTNLLLPLITALTPTNPPPAIVPSSQQSNNAAALSAILGAITPILTPTQSASTDQLFAAALATLAGTPTHPSPTTNFPTVPISQQPTTTSTGATVSTGTASAPIPTTTTTTSSNLNNIYKGLESAGIMDQMFQNHPDINFPGLMSHFQNGMPPHSQPLSTHNGYHQPGLGAHHGPPQQPGMIPIKSEPGTNGYGHSLQGNTATGMCQPPPQNLSCAPSTSSQHQQMSSYGLSNSIQELELSEQERRKLERKRARNRMAASKCRQRKIERISQLETEVQQERQRFQTLQSSLSSMEKTISMLQNELQRHKHAGCSLDKTTLNLMNHLSSIMNNNTQVPMDTR